MIDENRPIFPNNIVQAIADYAPSLDEEVNVFTRPLQVTDPHVSLGVFASFWQPDSDSYEMRGYPVGGGTLGSGPRVPTLQRYLISVQAMVQHMDKVAGLNKHSVFAKMVRDMLLVNPVLGVALTQLSVTEGGLTERTQRRWVQTQRYASNELTGGWVYLATMEFMIETETA